MVNEIVNTILAVLAVWAFIGATGVYLVRHLDPGYYYCLIEYDHPPQSELGWETTLVVRHAFMWVWAVVLLVVIFSEKVLEISKGILAMILLIVCTVIYLGYCLLRWKNPTDELQEIFCGAD